MDFSSSLFHMLTPEVIEVPTNRKSIYFPSKLISTKDLESAFILCPMESII